MFVEPGNTTGQQIRRVVKAVLAASLVLSFPTLIHADVLVSSRFSNNILRYDRSTGAFIEIFAEGPQLQNPNGIAFGADGNLYVGLGDGGGIQRYNGSTGTFIDTFVAGGSGGLGGARDILFGPDGDLYVASGTTDQVLRYDGSTGAFGGIAATGNGMDGPVGLAFSADGRLFVGAALSNEVFVYDDGVFEMSFNAGPTHGQAVGLAFNSAGQLLAAQSVTNEVLAFDPDTGAVLGVFANGPSGTPIYLNIDGDELFAGAFSTGSVWRFDASTGALIDQFIGPGSGGLSGTHDIVFFPSAVPEPGTGLFLVLGGLVVTRRRRR